MKKWTTRFTPLSPRSRRRVRLFGWGVGASILTLLWFYDFFLCSSLSPVIIESGSAGWLLLTLAICAIMGALLWVEFLSAWKTKITD